MAFDGVTSLVPNTHIVVLDGEREGPPPSVDIQVGIAQLFS